MAAPGAARGLDVQLVRNGSRGLLWLEPLVEVATEQGRVAYGPVTADEVAGLFDAGLLDGGRPPARARPHRRRSDWLARQHRLTFARVGVTDPLDPRDFEAHDGMAGLRRALQLEPAELCDLVAESGLRGRGGAGFPTGIKWRTVLSTPGDAEVRRLQRRRGRQRDLRRPDADGGRPVRPHRGDDHRRRGRRRHRGLHLRPLGVTRTPSRPCRRPSTSRTCRVGSARRPGQRESRLDRSGSGPGRTSAVKRQRCWRAWRASAGWCRRSKPPLPAVEGLFG